MSQPRGFKVKFYRAEDGAEFVHLEFPGGDDLRRAATAQDREDYAAEYDAFRNGKTGPVGTDIAVLGISDTVAAVLKRQGFETVELLAGVADTEIRRINDGYSLQRKARTYLAENTVPPGVKREIEKLDARIVALEARLADSGQEG